ncbi:uncharacterized protein LOC132198850 isoform X1 [Neocloeon triangulifer]|uniref:uncharacterized protein LOC132198850 isoform X1 n=1 Tax=Neocloeon triangulifer TaxID=2078957 RepID=UPI00286F6D7C|nr:uncharacterized protein LOC132198850 isoform X1 [Neocloeon triangulifer]
MGDVNNSCILCGAIADEKFLLVANLDEAKFANWWLENFDVEIEKSVLQDKSGRVCKFCIQDARNPLFLPKIAALGCIASSNSDSVKRKNPIDWWTVSSCDSSEHCQGIEKKCSVVLESFEEDEVDTSSVASCSNGTASKCTARNQKRPSTQICQPQPKRRKINEFPCIYCFSKFHSLKRHLRSIHRVRKLVRCDQGECRHYVGSNVFQSHIQIYHSNNGILKCDICKKLFTNIIHHKLHVKYAHRSADKNISNLSAGSLYQAKGLGHEVTCVFCDFPFQSNALEDHILRLVHKDVHAVGCSYSDCHEYFDQRDDLVAHLKFTHPYLLDKKLKIDLVKSKKCNFSEKCDMIFESNEDMAEHIFNAHSDSLGKITSCFYCDKFLSHTSMISHLKETHKSSDVLKCPEFGCHQMFAEYCDWWGHIKCHHKEFFTTETLSSQVLEPTNVRCLECFKIFTSDASLADHLKKFHCFPQFFIDLHMRNLFRRCPKCPLSFKNQAGLNIHVMYVHREAEQNSVELVLDPVSVPKRFALKADVLKKIVQGVRMESDSEANSTKIKQELEYDEPLKFCKTSFNEEEQILSGPLDLSEMNTERLVSKNRAKLINLKFPRNELNVECDQNPLTFCMYCEAEPLDLPNHLIVTHMLTDVVKCTFSRCSQFMAREDLESHIETQHSGIDTSRFVACELCKTLFVNRSYYNLHVRHVHKNWELPTGSHPEPKKPFYKAQGTCSQKIGAHQVDRGVVTCRSCNEIFKRHLRKAEQNGRIVDAGSCTYPGCDEFFHNKRDLVDHLKSEHPYLTEKKCKPRSRNGMRCTFAHNCYKKFDSYDKMEKHIFVNHAYSLGKKMSCFYCDRFYTLATLRNHLYDFHKATEILKCPVLGCSQMYIFYADWWTHIKYFHKDFYKFETDAPTAQPESKTEKLRCKHCNQGLFKSENFFLSHMRRHHKYITFVYAQFTRERFQKCPKCPLSLKNEEGAEIHLKYAHEEKPSPSFESIAQRPTESRKLKPVSDLLVGSQTEPNSPDCGLKISP